MTLYTKYKLDLGTGFAQPLRVFLIQSLARRQESAYYQIVQLIAARVAQRIHRKDTGQGLKLKLNGEEALAIQVIIATNVWPGNAVDNVRPLQKVCHEIKL